MGWWVYGLIGGLVDWLVKWLVDWMIDWLVDGLIYWLIGGVVGWWIGWLIDWVFEWMDDRFWKLNLLVKRIFLFLIEDYCVIFVNMNCIIWFFLNNENDILLIYYLLFNWGFVLFCVMINRVCLVVFLWFKDFLRVIMLVLEFIVKRLVLLLVMVCKMEYVIWLFFLLFLLVVVSSFKLELMVV